MAVGTLEKKDPKKFIFSLMARPINPPPPLNGPVIKRRTLLAAFKSSQFPRIPFEAFPGALVLRALSEIKYYRERATLKVF